MGEVVLFRDYQSKAAIDRAHKALEEHFIRDANAIAAQLWNSDAGTIGLPFSAPMNDPA